MSVDAVSRAYNLEQSVRVRCFALQLNSNGSKEKDLDRSACRVGVRSTYAVTIGNLLLSGVDHIGENAGWNYP